MGARRVFLSYSWDDASHEAWVLRLAKDLAAQGLSVRLDKWHCPPGASVPQFMEAEIAAADAVIVICTTAYAQKAKSRQGGGGFELDIIAGFIFGGADRRKFIPIVRRGEVTPGERSALPVLFQSAHWIDFRADEHYACRLDVLAKSLGASAPLQQIIDVTVPTFSDIPSNPHLIPEPEQVAFVGRCTPKQIQAFWIPDTLPIAMANATGDDPAIARSIVQKANRLRQKANPEKPEQAITLTGLAVLGFVGPQSYWMDAFTKAAARGGRMLAALLLAVPDEVFAQQEAEVISLLAMTLGDSR